jgi:serine-type D-Ala-D-Ala carboxypeptidase (penicillin-binding protein 5/6)
MISNRVSPRHNILPALLLSSLAALVIMALPAAHSATPTGPNSKTPALPPAAKAQRNTIARDPYLGAIVVDAASGRVLFQDQPDAKGYPASVLKLMDLLIILDRIQHRQLSFQDQATVSARAAKTGGSQVWLAEKEVFTVDELLYALMVQSANDAAVALAEKVAGSTEAFVELMNQRAQQLGMASTQFHSVHGLPPGRGQQPDVTTPRDLSVLCRELLKYQDTLRYTATRERTFRPDAGKKTVVMRTHNHLMAQVEGCDGFKTGFFTQAGFSLAATATRNGQRVIAIVLGSTDRKVRDAKAASLLAKGFLALQSPPPKPASPTVAWPVQGARPPAPPAR